MLVGTACVLTHCYTCMVLKTVFGIGVLEFTGPEGVVAVPQKVSDCLWGIGSEASGSVTLSYRRLEKGTFVSFQPESRSFHEEVADDVKAVLESALHKYSVLTEGDWIQV
jgi:ubiquitin fusion degradation protein 1